MDFIACIEKAVGREAEKNFLPPLPGDVQTTCADMTDFESEFDFTPETSLERGVAEFVAWYRRLLQCLMREVGRPHNA